MKFCPKCNTEKPVSDFGRNRGRPDGLQGHCKECRNVYAASWYSENAEKHRERAKGARVADRQRKQDFLWNVLLSASCVDCGTTDPRVLEWDHLDPDEKKFSITTGISFVGMQRLKEELEKCDMRCANCHRIRTQEQFKTWRWVRYEKMAPWPNG